MGARKPSIDQAEAYSLITPGGVMKRLALVATIFASLSFASMAPAQVPADLEKAIPDRSAAVWKADAATWDRLTAPEFTVVGTAGRMRTKAERLAQLKETTPAAAPTMYEQSVKVY